MMFSKKNIVLIVLLLVFILKVNSVKEKFCTNDDCITICENNGYDKGYALTDSNTCSCKKRFGVTNSGGNLSATSDYNSVTYSAADGNDLAADICQNGVNAGSSIESEYNSSNNKIFCSSQIDGGC